LIEPYTEYLERARVLSNNEKGAEGKKAKQHEVRRPGGEKKTGGRWKFECYGTHLIE